MARPRVFLPDPKDCIKLGEEMVQFFKTHPDALHMSAFYSLEKKIVYKDWETLKKREEFVIYYEMALALIGIKYLDKTSNIRNGVAERWLRLYFKELRHEEDETARYLSDLRKQEAIVISDDLKKEFNSVMNHMSRLQSNFKKDLNNSSSE